MLFPFWLPVRRTPKGEPYDDPSVSDYAGITTARLALRASLARAPGEPSRHKDFWESPTFGSPGTVISSLSPSSLSPP